MERSIPIREGELHMSVPSGSMHWFSNHPDRMEVVEQSEHSATIRVANRPAIPEEPSAPPISSLALEVVVNYDPQGTSAINSWDDAGRMYHPIADPPETPDTGIAAQVETLVSEKTDTLSKIDVLYNYVSREIRYVAIEIGIGGYQPHPAPDVFKNKYGDCKDKATLLMSMLGHIGLRGYPALVGREKMWKRIRKCLHLRHLTILSWRCRFRPVCGRRWNISRRTTRRRKFSGSIRPRNMTRWGKSRKWTRAFSRSFHTRTAANSA